MVVVLLVMVRFVIVLDALFTRSPPVRVASPVRERVPPKVVLFETVSWEVEAKVPTER